MGDGIAKVRNIDRGEKKEFTKPSIRKREERRRTEEKSVKVKKEQEVPYFHCLERV